MFALRRFLPAILPRAALFSVGRGPKGFKRGENILHTREMDRIHGAGDGTFPEEDDQDELDRNLNPLSLDKYPIEEGEEMRTKSHIRYKVSVPRDKVQVRFSRSSGPGGQNVNKVETAVELRFNIDQADWLPTLVKRQLKRQLPNRINKEGEIILTSEKHRHQELNIDDAFNRLQEWINDASLINIYRKKTRPPEHAIERRLRQKKIRSEIKSRRQRRDD